MAFYMSNILFSIFNFASPVGILNITEVGDLRIESG